VLGGMPGALSLADCSRDLAITSNLLYNHRHI
jgi:hypothetical protein